MIYTHDMTIKRFANEIPIDIRQLLVIENGTIDNAISVKDNPEMQYLLTIWHTYIEPNKEISYCPICLATILTNFKQMLPVLIDIENEYQILKNL